MCDLCYVDGVEYIGDTKAYLVKDTRKEHKLCPRHYDEAVVELGDPSIEKVGRNELCPCKSSKKYKKCHGR